MRVDQGRNLLLINFIHIREDHVELKKTFHTEEKSEHVKF